MAQFSMEIMRLTGSVLRGNQHPSPCSTKSLVEALLSAMNIPFKSKASEFALFALLKKQFRERGVIFLHIDEFQHGLRAGTPDAIQKLQDALKSLMQIEGWPLHLILSGMPNLARFLEGDRQLASRSKVKRFELLTLNEPGHLAFVKSTVEEIVLRHCNLQLPDLIDADLPGRLIVSAQGSVGTLIQTVQEACFLAMDERRRAVSISDFAAVYRENTGCQRADNVFSTRNWQEIVPGNSLSDLGEPTKRRAAR